MLLIMRHLESEKNVSKRFSSVDDEEYLTQVGKQQGNYIANVIFKFVTSNNLSVSHIYCANSKRAQLTASLIAEMLNVDVKAFDNLRSNNSGELKGKSESEAWNLNPIFMKQLRLFRAGIYSSYDFVKIEKREDKHEFEKRVMECIHNILTTDNSSLQIIVLHHSSLTALIIYFARKYYHYPDSFYGHVACDLGNIYLINEKEILLCNETVEALLELPI